MRRPDSRSREAEAYRRWYSTARWRDLRADQLARYPLCAWCEQDGLTTAATVCDHAEPHRGDEAIFWRGPFISLCKPHHDTLAQRRDTLGYLPGCDAAGRPRDPTHPWNRPTTTR